MMELPSQIVGIFNKSFFGLFLTKSRKIKELNQLLEVQKVFKKSNSEFYECFIKPDLEEVYFFLETGIKTQQQNILKLIELRNKLGGIYNWSTIKRAMVYFNFETREISISISRPDRILNLFWVAVGLFVSIIGGLIIAIPPNVFKYNLATTFVQILGILILGFGFVLIYLTAPFLAASFIKRRLKYVEKIKS